MKAKNIKSNSKGRQLEKDMKNENKLISSEKEVYQISFSGGRTSAYMTKMLIDNFSDQYEFIVTFANTGLEHEKTLEFINNCDKYFGFKTVWLEAVVFHGERVGTGFKIVDFKTASRKGEPFESVIKKYGIPNPSYPHCTRELKLSPMRSYLKSLGINHKHIKTAIGIREDETRRVSKQAGVNNITYPLIDLFPVDKQDVINWWKEQPFDLSIEEWDGNCKGCFKKSFKKIFKQLDTDPRTLDFHVRMEELYPRVGNSSEYIEIPYKDDDGEMIYGDNGKALTYLKRRPDRVFFRGNTAAKTLLETYREESVSDESFISKLHTIDGGCSESCEVYLTE